MSSTYTAKLGKSSDDLETLVKNNVELGRLRGLSEALKKVAQNIVKFPFNEEVYNKFVNDFGGRKQVRKQKLLEDIQKSLFVA